MTRNPFEVTLPPIYSFGRLMGIVFDPIEHVLFLADYGFDRVEKISFESENSLKFKSIESILKPEFSQQAALNPLMSVYHDGYIYWIDAEDGLKTTVYKSSCIRTVYKIKETTSLRFIQIGTFRRPSDETAAAPVDDKSSIQFLNRLVSLQEASGKFQYPPDYYLYNTNEQYINQEPKLNELRASAVAATTKPKLIFVLNIFVAVLFVSSVI